jgi:hypothetical protein
LGTWWNCLLQKHYTARGMRLISALRLWA